MLPSYLPPWVIWEFVQACAIVLLIIDVRGYLLATEDQGVKLMRELNEEIKKFREIYESSKQMEKRIAALEKKCGISNSIKRKK